ncbi:MAG: RrF2 family transcriptional regulator, partial [Planctomycetota bacterium]
MQITRATTYALSAVLQLADSPTRVRSAPWLAEATGVPTRFLAKILSRLSRARLLISTPGARGGFRLSRPASRISVWDVVEAVEDSPKLIGCLENDEFCGRAGGACAMQEVWKAAQDAMVRELSRSTLDEVARRDAALKSWPTTASAPTPQCSSPTNAT